MGLPGDDRVADQRTQRRAAPALREGVIQGRADRRDPSYGGATHLKLEGDAEVLPFRRRRESLAERLERDRFERRRAERERRARIERERAARERAARERWEQRRRERAAWLLREREEALRRRQLTATPRRPPDPAAPPARRRRASAPAPRPAPQPRIPPGVEDPARKRERAAGNLRRAAGRKGLFWPTAKASFAVTLALGVSVALGTVIGLPMPGLDQGSGHQSLAASASLFPVDPGTPPGLRAGYVFPVAGPHDFGEAAARFGAERYGHAHEGQDLFARPGAPLLAVRDGVVLDGAGGKSFYAYGGGNSVVIYSPDVDRSFVYLHMLHPARVRAGDQVHAGQMIGQLGCTGSCDGPHLHFEIRMGRVAYGHEGRPVDPLPYLRQWPQPTAG
jgi:murein DD-endopeptidase MepM/ murein hydrolase activator NlpD